MPNEINSEWAIYVIGILIAALGIVWGLNQKQTKQLQKQHDDELAKEEKEKDEFKSKLFDIYDVLIPLLTSVEIALAEVIKIFKNGKGAGS